MWKKGFRRHPEGDEERSVIGSNLHVQGPIRSTGELEIHGRVEGEIIHSGRLIITAGAVCLGTIRTDELELAGEVHGDIHVRDRLELLPTAHLVGDVFCSNLQINQGAIFQGTSQMTEGSPPEPGRPVAIPAPASSAPADHPPAREQTRAVHLLLETLSFQGGFAPGAVSSKTG